MNSDIPGAYGPLVPTAKAFGISRSTAFQLVRKGLLNTFTIGRKRMVWLKSLIDLPARLAKLREESKETST